MKHAPLYTALLAWCRGVDLCLHHAPMYLHACFRSYTSATTCVSQLKEECPKDSYQIIDKVSANVDGSRAGLQELCTDDSIIESKGVLPCTLFCATFIIVFMARFQLQTLVFCWWNLDQIANFSHIKVHDMLSTQTAFDRNRNDLTTSLTPCMQFYYRLGSWSSASGA